MKDQCLAWPSVLSVPRWPAAPGIGPFVCGVCLLNEEAVILYSCLLMVRARGRERGAKGGEGKSRVERKMRSWHIYPVTNNESHYTVWTVWISVGVRVRVRVDFIF